VAVTVVAVTVVAATEAEIGKTLAAAAAEDVLHAAVVAGGAAVAAVAADSVPAVAVIFLRPNTLRRKVANLAVAIAVRIVAVIAAGGVSSAVLVAMARIADTLLRAGLN